MIDAYIEPAADGSTKARRLDVAVDRRGIRRARLVFARGAAHVTLRTSDIGSRLFSATFFKCLPEIAAERLGTIVVRYPRTSILNYRAFSAEIDLATGTEWTLEAENGQTDVVLDLRGIALAGMFLRGGQAGVTLKLPSPVGSVPICLDGGVFNTSISRPAGVPIEVRVAGGLDDCTFDGRQVDGGDADFVLRQDPTRVGRYLFTITGGASGMHVVARPPV